MKNKTWFEPFRLALTGAFFLGLTTVAVYILSVVAESSRPRNGYVDIIIAVLNMLVLGPAWRIFHLMHTDPLAPVTSDDLMIIAISANSLIGAILGGAVGFIQIISDRLTSPRQ